jgi:phosphatidylserine decarboxylase
MHPFRIQLDREGLFFVGLFGLVTLVAGFFSVSAGVVGLVLTLWCVAFFRDPDRMVPQDPDLVVSPADGVVCGVEQVVPPAEWDMGDALHWRVSIFLNVFDVHVNRIPLQGTVRKILYHPGKFLNASLDKASTDNERNTLVMDCRDLTLACVQIAGLVARRIRCDLHEHETVATGQRLGMIRFGSRVDVYMPLSVMPQVVTGQRAVGGETCLARLGKDQARPVALQV